MKITQEKLSHLNDGVFQLSLQKKSYENMATSFMRDITKLSVFVLSALTKLFIRYDKLDVIYFERNFGFNFCCVFICTLLEMWYTDLN